MLGPVAVAAPVAVVLAVAASAESVAVAEGFPAAASAAAVGIGKPVAAGGAIVAAFAVVGMTLLAASFGADDVAPGAGSPVHCSGWILS